MPELYEQKILVPSTLFINVIVVPARFNDIIVLFSGRAKLTIIIDSKWFSVIVVVPVRWVCIILSFDAVDQNGINPR